MISLIISLTSSFLVQAADKNFSAMKSQVEKAVSCRTKQSSADATTLLKSVQCYQSVFSNKLSTKEQGGMSYWFNSLTAVKKIWACDGKEYQLKSYSRATPYFVCVQIQDAEKLESTRLIFFENGKQGFRINNIYTPIKW
ncbi:MAG: hypothetical protein J7501_10790 [Bdellovibrio sp.]|nr:hypothetical protein [Bdellovibrio sp.]